MKDYIFFGVEKKPSYKTRAFIIANYNSLVYLSEFYNPKDDYHSSNTRSSHYLFYKKMNALEETVKENFSTIIESYDWNFLEICPLGDAFDKIGKYTQMINNMEMDVTPSSFE